MCLNHEDSGLAKHLSETMRPLKQDCIKSTKVQMDYQHNEECRLVKSLSKNSLSMFLKGRFKACAFVLW